MVVDGRNFAPRHAQPSASNAGTQPPRELRCWIAIAQTHDLAVTRTESAKRQNSKTREEGRLDGLRRATIGRDGNEAAALAAYA